MPVPALDGLPYIPSVIGYAKGRAIVGAPARAHFFLSPTEVLFGPARHLGGGQVTLGEKEHEPEVLVARLLEQAVAAAAVVANGTIDGVALSRAAWASPEARRALAEAAHRAGMNLVRTEVATTLAAIALHAERGTTGRMAFVDVGGWKIEATVVEIEAGVVRALGRGVDATIGANWLDGRLVKALVHQVAPNDERTLLGDRLCYAMLREQCESLRIRLSTETVASLALPFLVPMLGVKEAPAWRLQRNFLEQLTLPLLDAIRVACAEAVEHAGVEPGQITDTFVLGGLAHMPAVRNAVSAFFGRPATARGDVDGLAARGAALAAEASLGLAKLKVVDDLDDRGVATEAAGWGQVIPPFVTPTPEPLVPSAMPAPAIETAHVLPATLPAAGVEASMPSPSGHDPCAVTKALPPDHPPAKVHAVHVGHRAARLAQVALHVQERRLRFHQMCRHRPRDRLLAPLEPLRVGHLHQHVGPAVLRHPEVAPVGGVAREGREAQVPRAAHEGRHAGRVRGRGRGRGHAPNSSPLATLAARRVA